MLPLEMLATRPFTTCCAFLFLAGLALAEKKTFKVVSFSEDVKVSVNGKSAKMERLYPGQPLYSIEVDDVWVGPIQYRYVQDGIAEEFQRVFPDGAESTFNDFYGRKDTIKHLPQLPLPFKDKENGRWTRGMGQVNPFNETYIPTVHFTGTDALKFFRQKSYERKKRKEALKVKGAGTSVFFILQNEATLLKDVGMTTYSNEFAKPAIRMTLADGDEYYGRNVIKFRFGENDPTMMREKLYTDLLVAVGAPVHKTGLVRVYVNGLAVGLYILQDESSDEKFIRTEFYADREAPNKMGYPLDADTGSDFFWKEGIKNACDSFTAHASFPGHRNYNPEASNKRVVELSRALYKLDPTDEKAVDEFDRKWFDIDVFFKAMVFEYALGHWDSYWGMTTNFALYDDPTESNPPESYKFYFLDEDFEYTFGLWLSDTFNKYDMEFTKQSYKTLINRTWGEMKDDAKRRTMLDKLLSTKKLTERFESILIAIFKHLLNPKVMNVRIDALAERYRPEIKWDRSIKRLRKGALDRNWTLEDLDYGINGYPTSEEGNPNCVDWGLKPYIKERADAVAEEFNITFSDPVLHFENHEGVTDDHNVEESKVERYQSSIGDKSRMEVVTFILIVTSTLVVAFSSG